eukprot:TRINITY_DN7350_c0_g1_i4.p1 TRINITY_DN7350_c0_g1~~TRINITY_DN7350_c0_g1_i4.p1  ORF type:complete len:252 (-),score=43.21 TRINITY_DN7350_c0_g1_i4:568-1323(-)
MGQARNLMRREAKETKFRHQRHHCSVSTTCASEGIASVHDTDVEDDDELSCQDKSSDFSGGITTSSLCERAEVPSLRWKRALGGRHPSEMPEGELRALMLSHGAAVPLQCRVDLWPRWFAAAAETQPNIVAELASRFLSSEELTELQENIPHEVARLIELDLPRTMPQVFGIAEQCRLNRVLRVFAALHPEIGYCQDRNTLNTNNDVQQNPGSRYKTTLVLFYFGRVVNVLQHHRCTNNGGVAVDLLQLQA